MADTKILITGANGQIGTVLTSALRDLHGRHNVLATDLRPDDDHPAPFEALNVLDRDRLVDIIRSEKITQIYHLAAILSADGEKNPRKTWDVNLNGLLNILDAVRDQGVEKVFFPSSIAVFGKTTPRIMTPQDVPLLPTTVYGMSKACGENWCNYYAENFDVDVRSIRYPGVIGYQSIPSGGTTDYAVEIFHGALTQSHYSCFLSENTVLPMIYMEDVIRATIEIMEAPGESVRLRYGYNVAGMSFSPKEIARVIMDRIPGFTVEYNPDFRQSIAESWNESIDDSMAREHWNWKPSFDLEAMSDDMIFHLKEMINH